MITVYRGTVDRSGKGYPGSVKLTVDNLKDIAFKNVIYGERSQSGAMGNAGGIIIDVLDNGEMTRYETNSYEYPEVAAAALLRIAENEDFFNLYAAGMGNSVFVKKGIELTPHEIKGEKERHGSYFSLNYNGKEYRIICSVYGVFRGLRAKLEITADKKSNNGFVQNSLDQLFRKGKKK